MRRGPLLEACLQSIRACNNEGVKVNLQVVEGQRSAAANRNVAIDRVESSWFVIMDDDVVVRPGWLRGMLEHVDATVGQVQPRLVNPDGTLFSAEKVFTTPWGAEVTIGTDQPDDGRHREVRRVEMLSGTCCLYNTDILSSCRFDEDYPGSQWEDTDFSMQIRDAGFALLYCGNAAVVHNSQMRNVNDANREHFLDKWFGDRSITERGVIYTGFECDIHCPFCYYKYSKARPFYTLDELKTEALEFRYYYRDSKVDISGGEPTIHPDIIPFVAFCSQHGLVPSIITHGQNLDQAMCRGLKDAGLGDLLVSYHGTAKSHDILTGQKGGYTKMRAGVDQACRHDIPIRTNTVVTSFNYNELPTIAALLADIPTRVANFIMFNPFEEWMSKRDINFQIRYSQAAPYIREAIDLLAEKRIRTNIRYMPFCFLKGYEKHICNFGQLPYDEHEWTFKPGYPARSELYNLHLAMAEQSFRYCLGNTCRQCAMASVCGGLPSQYAEAVGWDETEPYRGMAVRDPLFFKRHPNSGMVDNPAEPLLDIGRLYPFTIKTDPLVMYRTRGKMVPFEHDLRHKARAVFVRARRLFMKSVFRVLPESARVGSLKALSRLCP